MDVTRLKDEIISLLDTHDKSELESESRELRTELSGLATELNELNADFRAIVTKAAECEDDDIKQTYKQRGLMIKEQFETRQRQYFRNVFVFAVFRCVCKLDLEDTLKESLETPSDEFRHCVGSTAKERLEYDHMEDRLSTLDKLMKRFWSDRETAFSPDPIPPEDMPPEDLEI